MQRTTRLKLAPECPMRKAGALRHERGGRLKADAQVARQCQRRIRPNISMAVISYRAYVEAFVCSRGED